MLFTSTAILITAIMLQRTTSNPLPQNIDTSDAASLSNIPLTCYDDMTAYLDLDFSTCSGANNSITLEPEYPYGRQFWSLAQPGYFYKWSAPGSDCFIGMGVGTGNKMGKFFLKNVQDDVLRLHEACPGKGGKFFLYTRQVEARAGWFVEVKNINGPVSNSIESE